LQPSTRNRAHAHGSAFSDGADPARSETADEAAPPPDTGSGPPDRIWNEYFQHHRPSDDELRKLILRLHRRKEHEHVIHALQAALLHGQSQPWMYEVLALSMEIAGRPKAEVQRVLLSLTDFGPVDFTSMMYSAAYLTRFDRDETALFLYRQASRLAPERPEPYILGLKLARKQEDAEAIVWAAAGILEHGWTRNYETIHREAEDAVGEVARRMRAHGDEMALADLTQTITAAKRRDLMVTLTWNGAADLDVIVEEPGGTVCSFESPDSPGGGIHLHDGYGPAADNCREVYVCPQGLTGEYRVRIRRAWGDVVGRRAQLTVTRHAGTPDVNSTTQTVVFEGDEVVVAITLDAGRRTRPRDVATSQIDPLRAAQDSQRGGRRDIALTGPEEAARERFRDSREMSAQSTGRVPRAGAGAVGFQTVITNVPDGSFLQAQAIISADRRYVRMAINPVFTALTDVFTFSFINGVTINTGVGTVGGPAGGGIQPGQ
jgi:hypothetical protein